MKSLIQRLHPVKTQIALTRIGAAHDGGYLMPDDFGAIAACFSPGVGPTSSFEMDLQARYGIPSHLCDYSVDAPPNNFQPASFEKKYLGVLEDETFTTLNRWMERKREFQSGNDLILQMDIEGGEYPALLAVDEDKLRRFRMIVIEFHHVEHWADPVFFDVVAAVFSKLLKHFHPVHLHPNNSARVLDLRSITVPDVFELTLLRRDRGTVQGYCEDFPHPLDSRCDPRLPEVPLPAAWRGPVLAPAAPSSDHRSVFK